MEKKKKKSLIKGIFKGEWLAYGTYKKHSVEVVLVVAVIMIYISFKFSVQVKLKEIIELRKELTNVRANMINVSSQYNSITRESAMIELADSMKLGLEVSEQPAYDLDKIKNK